jgi:hypothetical protein
MTKERVKKMKTMVVKKKTIMTMMKVGSKERIVKETRMSTRRKTNLKKEMGGFH